MLLEQVIQIIAMPVFLVATCLYFQNSKWFWQTWIAATLITVMQAVVAGSSAENWIQFVIWLVYLIGLAVFGLRRLRPDVELDPAPGIVARNRPLPEVDSTTKVDYHERTKSEESVLGAHGSFSLNQAGLRSALDEPTTLRLVQRLSESGEFTSLQIRRLKQYLAELVCADTDVESDESQFSSGDVFASYTIVEKLGEGGVAQVYSAKKSDGHIVALKVLKHIRLTARFEREMELAQRLAHPNIVTAYEVGCDGDFCFIAMELLDGPDLHHLVKDEGPLTWQQSYSYILQIARALQQAHVRGLVHRDVKPGNIILHQGKAKLADLGAAVLREQVLESADEFQTQTGALVGTPSFMAPEQARSSQEADHRSDIYSLGATWFYLLEGHSRVEGSNVREKIKNLIKGDSFRHLTNGKLPPKLQSVFDRMIEYDPAKRFGSVAELIAGLDALEDMGENQEAHEPIRVLLVEDNDDDVLLTVEMFRRSNQAVDVFSAGTLAEGIEKANEVSPAFDIILLDLRLPDSEGLETVRRMRQSVLDIPIVVLTGQEDLELGRKCIELGADEFACKNDLTAHLLERTVFITLSRSRRNESE